MFHQPLDTVDKINQSQFQLEFNNGGFSDPFPRVLNIALCPEMVRLKRNEDPSSNFPKKSTRAAKYEAFGP